MEENSLVKKELNFFQRIRKSLYLRGMNAKKANKYYLLPDYLKQDDDVVNYNSLNYLFTTLHKIKVLCIKR